MRYSILFLLLAANAQAQSNLSNVLAEVAKNNKTIVANAQYWATQNLQYRVGNMPNDPIVGYDFMVGSPANAGNQHDFTVTQGFDFPTVYMRRDRLADAQTALSDSKLTATRQDILLEAKKLCIALVHSNKLMAVLAQRRDRTEKLLADLQLSLNKGEGNVLDVHKAQLQLIEIKRLWLDNASLITQLNQKLTELNGGREVTFTDTLYAALPLIPIFDELEKEYESRDPLLRSLEQEKVISEKQVSLSKALWLPKIEVGYHYQGILGQNYNGVHTGISVPMWQQRNAVNLKKAELVLSDLQLQAHTNEHYFHIKHMYERYLNLKTIFDAYQAYDRETMSPHISLLDKALRLGHITVMEYFTESTFFYNATTARLSTEKEYHEVIAELYKYEL